jgi:hypothetical protein
MNQCSGRNYFLISHRFQKDQKNHIIFLMYFKITRQWQIKTSVQKGVQWTGYLQICWELLIQQWRRLHCGNCGEVGAITKFTEGIKDMWILKWEWRGNYIWEGCDSNTGLRQSCSLLWPYSTYWLKMYSESGWVQQTCSSSAKAGISIITLCRLCGTITNIYLQRTINCIGRFFKEWKWKINVEKIKITVKLRMNEKWRLDTETTNKIQYLDVILNSRGR